MLKKKITTVIIVIALVGVLALSFTACNKNKTAAEKKSYDYSKILKGDLSDFAGTYVNGRGDKLELKADGSYSDNFRDRVFLFDEKSGTYLLIMHLWQDSLSMFLFPVGVDAYNSDGKLVKTDKTKIRLHSNNPHPSSSDDLFYRESSEITGSVDEEYYGGPQDDTGSFTGPSYLYATTNLRLRSEPDTSKDNRIAGVPQGSRVEFLEWGDFDTIDNMTKLWYKVKTEDGTTGWLFSGYLSETAPLKSYDYEKILKGNLSDFAGNWKNGNGEDRTLRNDGTFVKGQKASGFTSQNNPKQAAGGDFYMWGVNASEGGGFAVTLFPIGVDVMGYEGIIPTDKTKVRLTMGQDLPSSSAEVFYLE